MNRKLIRTRLSEIKEREAQQPKDSGTADAALGTRATAAAASATGDSNSRAQTGASGNGSASAGANRKRQPTPETNAEVFYYKKQIETHTPMVILLQDGEEIEGTIEWYDRSALKINRKSAPNVMLLKHNIKYMYKLEDRTDD